MLQMLTRYWWTLTLRGALGVIFGLVALFLPGVALPTLVLLFGAYALADGVFALAAAVTRLGPPGALVLQGLLGLAAGVMTFVWPGLTAVSLLYLVAGWAVVSGVFQIVAAVRLRKELEGEALLVLGGLASVAFGVVAMIWPVAGALAVVWLIGSYAILFGALLIGLSLRLRALRRPGEAGRAEWHARGPLTQQAR